MRGKKEGKEGKEGRKGVRIHADSELSSIEYRRSWNGYGLEPIIIIRTVNKLHGDTLTL